MGDTKPAAVDEQTFERLADLALRALEKQLVDLDGLEADLESGILTLEFEDGTKYVVNSHRAARQIWMAAERNAWHFDVDPASPPPGTWRASKSGEELVATLAGVVSRKLGRDVRFT